MNSPLARTSSAQSPKPSRSNPALIRSIRMSLSSPVSGARKYSITRGSAFIAANGLRSSSRQRRSVSRGVSSRGSAANRLLVQGEPDPRADRGDDPEPEHDLRLRPGHHLEMMVERRHQQDPAPEGLEGEDLGGNRERLDHEDAADDDQQDL